MCWIDVPLKASAHEMHTHTPYYNVRTTYRIPTTYCPSTTHNYTTYVYLRTHCTATTAGVTRYKKNLLARSTPYEIMDIVEKNIFVNYLKQASIYRCLLAV